MQKLESSDKFFSDVEQLIALGRLAEAADKLNAIASLARTDPRLYMLGMRLAEAAGNGKAAIESARRAVACNPQWAPAVLDLALLFGRLNQFAEAVAEAERAVALAPGSLSVLNGAIDVAQRAGDMTRSAAWLEAALTLEPGNAGFRRRLAAALSATGAHERALEILDGMLESEPDDTVDREARAVARARAGDAAGAVADWDALLKQSPDNVVWQYRRAVAAGTPPAIPPLELVSTLFDGLASIYDMHMLRGLRYRLPKDVADRILELYPDRKLNVLDLGCGTGLLGLMLQRIDGALVGVDASAKMLGKAAEHGLYDKFHQVDLLTALEATPESLYQVITALDVFIYVGDLSKALPNALRILSPGGRLFFSCEMLLEDDGSSAGWALLPTGRYAHGRTHVEALCSASGFAPITIEEVTLRYEGGQPVAGLVVEAVKPDRRTQSSRAFKKSKATGASA